MKRWSRREKAIKKGNGQAEKYLRIPAVMDGIRHQKPSMAQFQLGAVGHTQTSVLTKGGETEPNWPILSSLTWTTCRALVRWSQYIILLDKDEFCIFF